MTPLSALDAAIAAIDDAWRKEDGGEAPRVKLERADDLCFDLIETHGPALRRALECEAELQALRDWLDNNTTFYDVDADCPVDAPNVPVLAQVSNRIWYHATDDQEDYPFSEVAQADIRRAALSAAPKEK